jgi:hypothetical protein
MVSGLSHPRSPANELKNSWFVELTCSLIPLVELCRKNLAFPMASGLTPFM